jgi:fumarate reductase subunit D
MAIAKKALVWSLFAVGGTLTAFLFPALIALFLLLSIGAVPQGLSFESAQEFTQSWFGKCVLFGTLSLSVWHAAHRMRVIFHDLGIRADRNIALGLYLLAALGTIMSAVFLLQIH